MLDEAKTLFQRRTQVDTQRQILETFNIQFLLSEEELAILTIGSNPLTVDFYNALAKAKKIHQNSQILLGFENQRLGLEILETISKNLEAGYQKLYRCVQHDFKTLDLENSHMNASVRKALRVLAERRSLFESCLDAFAEVRQRTLTDAFHKALSGSSEGSGGPRPIDFGAHEPLRYIGDMLAWAHSTTVSECEALEVLFVSEGMEMAKGMERGLQSEPWLHSDGDEEAFDGRKALERIVSRNLLGVAQLLRQRIEHVIRSHDEPVLAYKISNLLQFYRNIFTKVLDISSLIDTLKSLSDVAMDQFRAAMRFQISSVEREDFPMDDALTPPAFLEMSLKELQALLKTYDTSTVATDAEGSDLEAIITHALDPFLAHCEKLATSLSAPLDSTFAINCLVAAKEALAESSHTRRVLDKLDDTVDTYAAKLSQYQHRFLLRNSGLSPLVGSLTQFAEQERQIQELVTLPICSPESLMDISQELDDFLPSALLDASRNLKHLRDPVLSQRVTEEAARRFCDDFEMVESKLADADKAIHDEHGADGNTFRAQLSRTSEEIRILLS